MAKKSKGCSKKNRKIVWYAFTFSGLIIRALTVTGLFTIASQLSSLKNESKIFNTCTEEQQAKGRSVSSAVSFCNGGDN